MRVSRKALSEWIKAAPPLHSAAGRNLILPLRLSIWTRVSRLFDTPIRVCALAFRREASLVSRVRLFVGYVSESFAIPPECTTQDGRGWRPRPAPNKCDPLKCVRIRIIYSLQPRYSAPHSHDFDANPTLWGVERDNKISRLTWIIKPLLLIYWLTYQLRKCCQEKFSAYSRM